MMIKDFFTCKITIDYAKKLTLIMLSAFYKKWGVIVSKITIFFASQIAKWIFTTTNGCCLQTVVAQIAK